MIGVHHKAESYRACDLCNPPVDCASALMSTPDRPCWGKVKIEFETDDGEKVHVCGGHEWIWSDAFYRGYLPESEADSWPPVKSRRDVP